MPGEPKLRSAKLELDRLWESPWIPAHIHDFVSRTVAIFHNIQRHKYRWSSRHFACSSLPVMTYTVACNLYWLKKIY